MDAEQVKPAWQLVQQGVVADDPLIKETQERLGSCMYAMAHPETGEIVPACVQHSVLDPIENIGLRTLLPLEPKGERKTGITNGRAAELATVLESEGASRW